MDSLAEEKRTKKAVRAAIDVGGTFTDAVIAGPGGSFSAKALTRRMAPEEGAAEALNRALAKAGLAADSISTVVHGTTLATNAVIERRGARTALIATKGFRDILEFAYGQRCDQYDLELTRPEPLIPRPLRFEAAERAAADGSVLLPLDVDEAGRLARKLVALGVDSVAVAFMHAYRFPDHEKRMAEILSREAPNLAISLSHEICPEIREYDRMSTTAVNAYVQPLMRGYLGRLSDCLGDLGCAAPILMIMSSGSLTSLETAMRFPVRLVESGPAGGAILARQVALEKGARSAVALDMGGTTAKIVLLNDGEPRRSRAMEVARAYRFLPGSGLPIRIPVIDLIEIGAGGGSIASVDSSGRVLIGPESAGSEPGPACYGRGGERATVSDADLALARLSEDYFAGGAMRIDAAPACAALQKDVGSYLGGDALAAAADVCEIVDENMANAMRVHAADNGDTLDGRTLVATGGAAPLHAARVAQKLGIRTTIVPRGAGVGSAHGFLLAPVAYEAVRSAVFRLDAFDAPRLNGIFADLRHEAECVLRTVEPEARLIERRFSEMRYRGQGHELLIEIPARDYSQQDGEELSVLFAALYRQTYARDIPGLAVEALTWTLLLTCDLPNARLSEWKNAAPPRAEPKWRAAYDHGVGRAVEARVYMRETLAPGAKLKGPALILEEQTTTWAPTGFEAEVDELGSLILTRSVDE